MLKIKLKKALLSLSCIAMCAGFSASNQAVEQGDGNQEHISTLRYQDVFNLEVAASPLFTADSKSIIYERVSMDIMTDSRRIALWQIDIDSGKHSPLFNVNPSVKNPRQASLSPDGERVAFIANDANGAQIFTYDLRTASITQLSYLQDSPSNLTWSPDGKHIAFTMFTPGKTDAIFKDMPNKPEQAQWAGGAKVIDKTLYRRDGSGYVAAGFDHIYIIPTDGGTPRQLTNGDYHHRGQMAWHPKQDLIYFSANRSDNWELEPYESNIYSVSTQSAEIREVTSYPGPESAPMLSENGNTLVFQWVNDRKLSYQVNQIMAVDLDDTSTPRSLTPELDRQIQDAKWQDDDIVFSYIDGGETRLAKVTLGGKFTKLPLEIGGQSVGRPYTSGDFATAENGSLVIVQDESNRPGDLVLVKGKKKSVLSDLNSDVFGHINTAVIEPINVRSSIDDLPIDAWIAYPPGFDSNSTEKLPLIIEIHGGPHAAYGDTFSMEVQLMAAQGYAVVWSNPRGSSSYGEDFANTIHHNYPSNDYQDLMDVVDASIATGRIDENNLFITGGSGGGVLTAWSIGKTDRFAAAVVAKPVINWLSFALTADAYPFFTQYWMSDMPWNIHDKLWAHSPLSLVGNVKTPTMLLTGEADYRTPISETEQYYHALRLQKIPSVMVRIPGASHGIAARPSHLIQKVGNIVSWFDRYNSQKRQGETQNKHETK
ncbi:S9 family peptidase [Glaciecola siphonariae]|uniref:S9 family peptidase n=1 Tax=Glaciecola siphonariae TaxID=521012 RepID=A0ABV9LT05_9ALTE